MLAPVNGFVRLDAAQFAGAYAADLAPGRAAFLARAQRPFGLDAFTGAVAMPAWRTKPSWYVVAAADRMIPPDVQRAMAARADAVVTEAASCHAVHEACPDAVADHIDRAARGCG
jgi:pimeloyl-ACP methyl ester carboxylesterase